MSMILTSLLVRNFRMIHETSLSLDSGMQLFLGQNAEGKTSLVESVLFLSTSTSHRTRREEELISWDEQVAFLRGEINDGGEQRTIECGLEKQRKVIKINGVALPRVGDLYGQLRTVLFAPEDLTIVGGSPQDRRRFLDIAIAQIDPAYIHILQQFRRALRQRNWILKRLQKQKSSTGDKELEVWNLSFVSFAAQVIAQRTRTISQLAPYVEEYYAALADDGPLKVSYSFDIEEDIEVIETYLRDKLSRIQQSEIERGSSQFGPHRDDLLLMLAGKNLGQFGSQGQRRAAVLALRLAQARLCRECVGYWPLLLIDDVIHEMDNNRRERFWRHIDPEGQIIVTATDREILGSGVEPTKIFKVQNGSISVD
jgi:DNA replication and repair protein RecF